MCICRHSQLSLTNFSLTFQDQSCQRTFLTLLAIIHVAASQDSWIEEMCYRKMKTFLTNLAFDIRTLLPDYATDEMLGISHPTGYDPDPGQTPREALYTLLDHAKFRFGERLQIQFKSKQAREATREEGKRGKQGKGRREEGKEEGGRGKGGHARHYRTLAAHCLLPLGPLGSHCIPSPLLSCFPAPLSLFDFPCSGRLLTHAHTRTHTRTHARTHTHMHAHTRAHHAETKLKGEVEFHYHPGGGKRARA